MIRFIFLILLTQSCKEEFKEQCYLDIGKYDFSLVSHQYPTYETRNINNLGYIIERINYKNEDFQYFQVGDILLSADNCGLEQTETDNRNLWPKMMAVLVWPDVIIMGLITEIEIIRNNRRLRLYGPRLTKIQILVEDVK